MKKKLQGKKGFTLMEMLIVVAIIAVLVAIMIPTMSRSMEQARVATDEANIRSAYAEAVTNAMLEEDGIGESSEITLKTSGGTDEVDIGGLNVTWHATGTTKTVITARMDDSGNVVVVDSAGAITFH